MLRDGIEKQNQENDKNWIKIAIKRLRTKSYTKIQQNKMMRDEIKK
jgi:hypothetical protein